MNWTSVHVCDLSFRAINTVKNSGKVHPGTGLKFKSSKKLPLSQSQLADCCAQRSCWYETQTGALLARGTLRTCAHLGAVNWEWGQRKTEKHCKGCKVCHWQDGEVMYLVWGTLFSCLFQSSVFSKGKKNRSCNTPDYTERDIKAVGWNCRCCHHPLELPLELLLWTLQLWWFLSFFTLPSPLSLPADFIHLFPS